MSKLDEAIEAVKNWKKRAAVENEYRLLVRADGQICVVKNGMVKKVLESWTAVKCWSEKHGVVFCIDDIIQSNINNY